MLDAAKNEDELTKVQLTLIETGEHMNKIKLSAINRMICLKLEEYDKSE
jgi:hypothetical protein